jgi:hypothetical protein
MKVGLATNGATGVASSGRGLCAAGDGRANGAAMPPGIPDWREGAGEIIGGVVGPDVGRAA